MTGLVPVIHAAKLAVTRDRTATARLVFELCGGRTACGRLLRNRLGMTGTSPVMTG
jgi:hypothetical protein